MSETPESLIPPVYEAEDGRLATFLNLKVGAGGGSMVLYADAIANLQRSTEVRLRVEIDWDDVAREVAKRLKIRGLPELGYMRAEGPAAPSAE